MGKRLRQGPPCFLGLVYQTPLATRQTARFCNLTLKGFNEVFICNSVISGLGLVHGPGYLFTYLDPSLAHFHGCNGDLFLRALLCN